MPLSQVDSRLKPALRRKVNRTLGSNREEDGWPLGSWRGSALTRSWPLARKKNIRRRLNCNCWDHRSGVVQSVKLIDGNMKAKKKSGAVSIATRSRFGY